MALASSPLTATHTWSTSGRKTVTATGQGDCQGQATAHISITGNSGPTVSLTAPGANSVHTTGAAITLTASASDAQGVSYVEFYDGMTLLATATSAPWSYSWTGASEGSHTLKAKAFDSLGASTDSATVTIAVQDVESISVSPATAVTGQAALVTVSGAATGCGAVTVNYGDGDSTTYAIDGLPISNYHTWTTGGLKTITVTGESDCSGTAQTSTTVNAAPSVTLTAPSNSDTFYSPATISLTATASDTDGSVASVTFYAGSTLLFTDTSSPYSYSWSGMANGTYAMTAVVTDNQGATTTSSAASITVADPATSTVTGIALSAYSVPVNTWVLVTVTGGNPCGAVEINFGDGDDSYLPIEALPYQYNHYWTTPGTYTVTATGQGNCAGQASTQITVTGEAASDSSLGAAASPVRSNRSRRPSQRSRLASPEDVRLPESEPENSFDERVTAMPLTTVSVTLDILAGASGTVTSSPSGFNCTGSDTSCSASFTTSATVTLTATPASGQTFLGWGGACSGTSSTCQITASEGLLVTAAFGDGASATIIYYHTDVLGSVRAMTTSSGATLGRIDYFPFGENGASLTGDPKKFLGQEQDGETALDYFEARYFRNVWGRFTTVDPGQASATREDPQGWNAYAYARNNPLRFIDTGGLTYRNEGSGWGATIGYVNDADELSMFDNLPWGYRLEADPELNSGRVILWTPNGWQVAFSFTWIGPDRTTVRKNVLGAIQDAGRTAEAGVDAALIVASPNFALMAITLIPAGELTSLGELAENGYLNRAIGDVQRRLLGDFLKTGRLPPALETRVLRIYRELARRAMEAGKDEVLHEQARRLALIEEALRRRGGGQ